MSRKRWIETVCLTGSVVWFLLVYLYSFSPIQRSPESFDFVLSPSTLAVSAGAIIVGLGIFGLAVPSRHGSESWSQWAARGGIGASCVMGAGLWGVLAYFLVYRGLSSGLIASGEWPFSPPSGSLTLPARLIIAASGIGGLAASILQGKEIWTQWAKQTLIGASCFAGMALWFVGTYHIFYVVSPGRLLLPPSVTLALSAKAVIAVTAIGGLAAVFLAGEGAWARWKRRTWIGAVAFGVPFAAYGVARWWIGAQDLYRYLEQYPPLKTYQNTHPLEVGVVYGGAAIPFGIAAVLLTGWLFDRAPLARRRRVGGVCFAGSALLAGVASWGALEGPLSLPVFCAALPAAVYGMVTSESVTGDETWTNWAWHGAVGMLVSGAIVGLGVGVFAGVVGSLDMGTRADPWFRPKAAMPLYISLWVYSIMGGILSLPAVPFGVGASSLLLWWLDRL